MPDATVVAMSGGVDSSVAACLLEVEHCSSTGRPVVGVSQLIWAKESQFPAALDLARDVCLRLGIPYFRVDLNREFERLIVRNFIDTYLEGQTPNPCVLCNQMIKFDILYRKVESELRTRGNLGEQDTLYFATGHYARVEAEEGGYALKKGRDTSKDQSYMLYRLPRSLLSRIVFPLGGLEKKEVIRMASRLDLPHREIRESQDACFLEGSYGDYLVEKTGRVDLRHPGDIVDAGGRVLGRHRGFICYTVGQRRGLGLGSGPWYVSRVDPIKNRVVVGRREEVLRRSFEVSDVNWLVDREESVFTCAVKVRYQTREINCAVRPLGPDCLGVELAAGEVVTPGQSAVFYREDRVLCGGIIQAPA